MQRILIPTLLLASFTATAQDLPQPSPHGRVEQVVGLTKISIDYSRPSVKGRKIFGELVPYGQVWRTGANKCTMIETDGPIEIEGNILEAGIYSMFTIPGEATWVIIFNRDTALWGEEDRKDSLDVLQLKVAVGPREGESTHVTQLTSTEATASTKSRGQGSKQSMFTETLTIDFEAVKDDRARIDLRWESTLVSLNIHADATQKALENIKAAMAKADADFRVYNSSARFLVDRSIDPEKALEWAQKSVSMERKFWNTYTLALAQAQNGKYTDAIATAEGSMKLAQEAKYDAYVKMNKERIEEWKMKK